MWTMHEYLNADNPSDDRDLGYCEFEEEEVMAMVEDAEQRGLEVYRPEYAYIIIFEDKGTYRHCWKFTR